MKALKIKLYQETVCYKKPYAFKVTETYPLPPYSTVIGMLHKVLGAGPGEYHKIDISVQGGYEGIFTAYNTTRFYKGDDITSMPLNVHMLYGVNLIIHVASDEKTLNDIYNGFKLCSSAFTLGRNEDLARIDEIKFVDISKVEFDEEDDMEGEDLVLKNCMYVPDKYNTSLKGISYKISKVYSVVNNLRQWEKVKVKYAEAGELLGEGEYYKDDEDDIAFFA